MSMYNGWSPDDQPRQTQQAQPQQWQAQQPQQWQQPQQPQQPQQWSQWQQPQYQQQPQQWQQPAQQWQYQQPVQQYQQPAYQPQPVQQMEPVERSNGIADFFKRRNMVMLICSAIAVVWFVIVWASLSSTANAAPTSGDEWEQAAYEIGTGLGLMMMMPFLVVSFIGTVFSCLSWLLSKKGFALTAGILFTVSLFLGGGNVIGYIPCAVLGYVGYAKLKKQYQK